MKPHEMREMALDELQHHCDTLVEELANLSVRLSLKQVDNPLRVRYLRREVARAKTIIQEKQSGLKPGEKPGSKRRED